MDPSWTLMNPCRITVTDDGGAERTEIITVAC